MKEKEDFMGINLVHQPNGQTNHQNARLLMLLNQTDANLANTITTRLPFNSFGIVNVNTVNHRFSGLSEIALPTRQISLTFTKSQYALGLLRAVFTGLTKINKDVFEKDVNRLTFQDQLLSCIEAAPAPTEEIVKVSKQCTKVHLFIAQNLTGIEIVLQKSKGVVVLYKTGECARIVIPFVLRITVFATLGIPLP